MPPKKIFISFLEYAISWEIQLIWREKTSLKSQFGY